MNTAPTQKQHDSGLTQWNKLDELDFVYDTAMTLLKNASSAGEVLHHTTTHWASYNVAFLDELFTAQSNVDAFLSRSFLFERVRREMHKPVRYDSSRAKEYQKSAKLHCLYGKPILTIGRLRSKKTYGYACSKVYDLRQYTEETKWGPFMGDGSGRVDWEKVEAVLITLAFNLHTKRLMSGDFKEIWDNPYAGAWSGSYAGAMGKPKAEPSSLELQDPYGITGTWYRVRTPYFASSTG